MMEIKQNLHQYSEVDGTNRCYEDQRGVKLTIITRYKSFREKIGRDVIVNTQQASTEQVADYGLGVNTVLGLKATCTWLLS